MEPHTFAALLLCSVIGVSLGLLGGGGSILAVPVLVYVARIDARVAVGMSLAIVGSTALVGSVLHRRSGQMDLRAALTFGGVGMLGAYLGAHLTHRVSGEMLLFLFAAVMLVVSVLMLRPARRTEAAGLYAHPASTPMTLISGLFVGVLTGFLGVGGGFLVVPALVLFAGLPMHRAVGTSLLVIAINSAAGFVGHLGEGELHPGLTVAFTLSAIVGVFLGEQIAGRVPAARLRRLFAIFVLVLAVVLIALNYQVLL